MAASASLKKTASSQSTGETVPLHGVLLDPVGGQHGHLVAGMPLVGGNDDVGVG